MANNRLLDNQLREKWTKFIFDMLTENGEDVGYIKDNVIKVYEIAKILVQGVEQLSNLYGYTGDKKKEERL